MLWPGGARDLPRGLRGLALLSALLGLTVAVPAATPTASADVTITLDGHGYGHGYGLSQWGAYGYAVDHWWSSAQILDHYYGGTVAGAVPTNTMITVRLQALDDAQTAVVSASGGLLVDGVGGVGVPWKSVVVRETSQGVYSVWARTDAQVCPSTGSLSAPWTLVKSGAAPSVTISTQSDSNLATDYGSLLSVCAPDGSLRAYRGAIRAINGSSNENRTVNEVSVEQYLRSVIAKEMSPGWADDGDGRGAQALQAQAVAARSYGLAENRYTYSKTCDSTACQAYYGTATRASVGASFVAVEHVWTDAAVLATAGIVRRVGTVDGPISYTWFAASSGGYTDAGPSALAPFTPVYDDGDDTALNPNHNWSVVVTGSAISAKYPEIGTFTSLTVLTRNGLGEWGGRVDTIRITGTATSITKSGDDFRSKMGLKSNWYNVRGSPQFDLCPITGPPPVVPTVGVVTTAADPSMPAVRCMEFFAA